MGGSRAALDVDIYMLCSHIFGMVWVNFFTILGIDCVVVPNDVLHDVASVPIPIRVGSGW